MILFLHFDSHNRELFVRMLRRFGFDAAALASGADAMTAMRRQKPRLLILNGTLSDMDAIELLQMVRADEELAGLPVCIMSGNNGKKADAERLGIAKYFLKPMDTDDFIGFVEKTLLAARRNPRG